MKRILFVLILLTSFVVASSQEKLQAYLQTDLTSAYLWRGQKNAGVSLQPVAGLRWHGFNLFAWGNVQLCPPAGKPDKHEIDLFLKYSPTKALSMGLKNVYVNTRGDGFLSYGSIPHAANGLDAFVASDFRVFNFEWSTTIAGYDGYNHSGKRAYGSYLTLNAPFKVGAFDCTATVGIVPYYCSRYSEDRSDGFHVNMCALKAQHTFRYADNTVALTPYTQLMVNPSARTAHFQIGARITIDPSSRH